MAFPLSLLDGFRHAILSVDRDHAKMVVFVNAGGIDGLARELIRRCPDVSLSRPSSTRIVLKHPEFHGELTDCRLAGSVLLDVCQPRAELADAIGALPGALARYVSNVTGNRWLGGLAAVGTLAVIDRVQASFVHNGDRTKHPAGGKS